MFQELSNRLGRVSHKTIGHIVPVVPGVGQVVVDPRGERVSGGGRRYLAFPHGNCLEKEKEEKTITFHLQPFITPN